MGVKLITLSDWRTFLISQGLELKRTSGGHEIWNLIEGKLSRPIVFPNHHREITPLVIKSCLTTLGITEDEFNTLRNNGFVHVSELRENLNSPNEFLITYKNGQTNSSVVINAGNKRDASNKFYLEHGFKSPILRIDETQS